jgi:hypothetical protein
LYLCNVNKLINLITINLFIEKNEVDNIISHIEKFMKKNKRGQEWGKGWDGKSRVPDKTYKENYDSIDWSYTKKEKKK